MCWVGTASALATSILRIAVHACWSDVPYAQGMGTIDGWRAAKLAQRAKAARRERCVARQCRRLSPS